MPAPLSVTSNSFIEKIQITNHLLVFYFLKFKPCYSHKFFN